MSLKSRFLPSFLFFAFLAFPLLGWGQSPESAPPPTTQPAASSNPPSEFEVEKAFVKKYEEKFQAIQEDLTTLNSRLEEGQKEIKKEGAKLDSFLQIEEISPEEFKPVLRQWQVMRDSYEDVLEDLNQKIDEVNQGRIRLESKYRLWQLKEGDLKLDRDQYPKGKIPPEIAKKLSDIHEVIQTYENQKDTAESLLTQLGKTKTQLSLSLEECNKNYRLLKKRWREIRFSYLKMRQQPKFSWETFTLASHEFQYRLRDLPTLLYPLKGYAVEMGKTLLEKPLHTFLFFAIFLLIGLGFHRLHNIALAQKDLPEEITLFERFGRRFFILLAGSYPVLFPWIAFGLLLSIFPEAREDLGLFLFLALTALYGVWLLNRSFKILLMNQGDMKPLLTFSPPNGIKLYRRLSLLAALLFVEFLIHLFALILGYESEATRLFNWLLVIAIFGVLISLIDSRWATGFSEELQRKLSPPVRFLIRTFLVILLTAIIGLDVAGYTNLSDYLADASLKTMALIPLFLFLKKGILELIEFKVFTASFTQLKLPEELRVKWKKTLRQWTHLFLSLFFFYWTAIIWDITPELRMGIHWILSKGFTVGSIRITVGLIISVILILYGSILLSRLFRAFLERNLYPRRDWDPGIRNAISTGVHYLILLIGFIFAIHLLGFDVRNITVLAGAVGVGLGFGLQNLANNFASGIVLLIERPVKVGDTIQVGSLMGKVRRIGARSTVIETADEAAILIPNGELLSGQVTNWTYSNSIGGIAIPIGVAYGSDVDRVKNVLLEVAHSNRDVHKDPAPRVEFKAFGDSSLNFLLRVWTDVDERIDVQTGLLTAIEKAFRENGIVIPFPQRDVTLHQPNGGPKK